MHPARPERGASPLEERARGTQEARQELRAPRVKPVQQVKGVRCPKPAQVPFWVRQASTDPGASLCAKLGQASRFTGLVRRRSAYLRLA